MCSSNIIVLYCVVCVVMRQGNGGQILVCFVAIVLTSIMECIVLLKIASMDVDFTSN